MSLRKEANTKRMNADDGNPPAKRTRNRIRLEADFLDVELFEKLAVLELVEETRLDDIGRFELVGALIGGRAYVDQRLERFGIQLGQRPQLRRERIIHGVHAHSLVARKIPL